MRDHLQTHFGHPLKVTRFPWWMMRLDAPFWELARELIEMRYLWDTPHQLCADTFTRLLPDFVPTPLDQVMLAGLPAMMTEARLVASV